MVEEFTLEPGGVSSGEIEKYVKEKNERLLCPKERLPSSLETKKVHTEPPAHRRLLIETFAFLSVMDCETAVALVCKAWLHVSRDQEAWKSRYITYFNPAVTVPEADYRSKYALDNRNSCWSCNKVCDAMTAFSTLVFGNRVVCSLCEELKECQMVDVLFFAQDAFMEKSTIKQLDFPKVKRITIFSKSKTFPCNSYPKMMYGPIVVYAEWRRRVLLSMLAANYSHLVSVADAVKKYDLSAWYRTRNSSGLTSVQMALVKFCGKTKGNEEKDAAEHQCRPSHCCASCSWNTFGHRARKMVTIASVLAPS